MIRGEERRIFRDYPILRKAEVVMIAGACRAGGALVRRSGFRSLHRLVSPLVQGASRVLPAILPEIPAGEIATRVRVAEVLSRTHENCLTNAYIAWSMMEARGIDASLRVGVRNAIGVVEAHAWVDVDGATVYDPGAQSPSFSAFDEDPLTILTRMGRAGSQSAGRRGRARSAE